MSWWSRRVLIFFNAIGFMFMAFVFGNKAFVSLYGYLNSSHWIQTQAKIVHAGVSERRSQDRQSGQWYTYYAPDVVYQFSHEERVYKSNRVDWHSMHSSGSDLSNGKGDGYQKAQMYIMLFQQQKPITVFFNPSNPNEAIVNRHFSHNGFYKFLILGLGLLLVGLTSTVILIRKFW